MNDAGGQHGGLGPGHEPDAARGGADDGAERLFTVRVTSIDRHQWNVPVRAASAAAAAEVARGLGHEVISVREGFQERSRDRTSMWCPKCRYPTSGLGKSSGAGSAGRGGESSGPGGPVRCPECGTACVLREPGETLSSLRSSRRHLVVVACGVAIAMIVFGLRSWAGASGLGFWAVVTGVLVVVLVVLLLRRKM